jgi:hypothetical protein
MLYYRRHAGNMTRGLKGAEFGLMRVYQKRIERIRRGEYDPNIARHVSWPEYLGRGPDMGDLPESEGLPTQNAPGWNR